MSIDVFENLIMLLATVVGLLMSLFHYIETPKRGWLYLTLFYLAHLVSDYYWTTYVLVIRDEPDVSAFMAYFGWNLSYVFLLLTVLKMRQGRVRSYFNPLMLLPVPINFCQFLLYNSFGGFFNNLWQCSIHTVIAAVCLQVILYRFKTRKTDKIFPHFHTLILFFVVTEFGMWTASCFDFPDHLHDPYYYFAFLNYILLSFFARGAGREYVANGYGAEEKSAAEIRFQLLLQILCSFIIFSFCIGGYYLAIWMKKSLPRGNAGDNSYSVIAVMLFVISIFLVILIMLILFFISARYRKIEHSVQPAEENRRNRYGLFFTVVITFVLMVFSVVYSSRIFYNVSVSEIYETGQDKSALMATRLNDYLSGAETSLVLAADTVDLMIRSGDPPEKIEEFLALQTENQIELMGDSFTGMYAYVHGRFMDGSGWVPPEGYDPTERGWYREAVDAGGEVVLVSPYEDVHTGSIVLTFCRMISGDDEKAGEKGNNVVALDVVLDHIQELMTQTGMFGKGYGFVVNQDGMIVAHYDRKKAGLDIGDVYGNELFPLIKETGEGRLNAELKGQQCTLFVNQVMGQWYVVIAVEDEVLFEETNSQLLVNILVSLIIFSLISFFYFLGYRNEQAYGKRMEEMRAGRQKQEYEARVLKLEKKSADEANKAKSSFLADMSHEIRTPINAILGMNEMILRESDNSDISEYAKNIDISGRNLLQLINSILDFSKIEDGKMEIVPVRYSLGSLITYIDNSVSERAKNKGLECIFAVDESLPSELYGDDARINQVIINLMTNAVKYTEKGSVRLTVSGRERSDGRIKLYVEVKDTGIGIRESDMDKLFKSFERLDVVRNRNIEGTGLGMTITTRLLDLMGSELKVESTYGEGSVFSFELWQGIENEDPIGDFRLSSMGATGIKDRGEYLYAPDARILVTDDTKMNIVVVRSLLKRTGIRMDFAYNGEEAIKLSEENRYDVILMDQRMPGMDGAEAMKRIRAQENGKNAGTPVICLTADAIRGAKDRYLAEGFDDYLSKPVKGRVLEQMLAAYLPPEKVEMRSSEEAAVTGENTVDDAAAVGSAPAGDGGSPAEGGSAADSAVPDGSAPAGDDGLPTEYGSAAGGAVPYGNAPAGDGGLPAGSSPEGDGADGMASGAGPEDITEYSLPYDELLEAGIDMEEGLAFCVDEDVYREVLAEFARGSISHREQLERCYKDRDWENYNIYVHALKSSARSIGAGELSELALSLETASREGKSEVIISGHGKAMEMYENTVNTILFVLNR